MPEARPEKFKVILDYFNTAMPVSQRTHEAMLHQARSTSCCSKTERRPAGGDHAAPASGGMGSINPCSAYQVAILCRPSR